MSLPHRIDVHQHLVPPFWSKDLHACFLQPALLFGLLWLSGCHSGYSLFRQKQCLF
jgi:hypothetical protein